MSSASSRVFVGWLICLGGLALATALVVLRDQKTEPGDRFHMTFVLRPIDLLGAQCALMEPAGGKECQFRVTDKGRIRPAARTNTLHPHWTTDRMLLLISALELDPEVIAGADYARTLPEEERVMAVSCAVEAVSFSRGGQLRWKGRTRWEPLGPVWTARASHCRVRWPRPPA